MITSARLTYRPFSRDDADELQALFRDPKVRQYLLDDRLVTEEWVREEIATSEERFATTGAGLWAVRIRNDSGRSGAHDRIGKIIGFVGFREFFDPPRLQLLYGLLPGYWGRGLATEAARRICDHAFLDLGFRLVEAATDAPNGASSRVLRRLGMRRVRVDGSETSGTVFYVLDRDSWATERTRKGGAA
ncbi:MAG: GNAT family N-acetyltransferase [Longimicrobiales bacterium]|nr:GNAT family N-acetyltransferase [Longimicrobiales bacterium]